MMMMSSLESSPANPIAVVRSKVKVYNSNEKAEEVFHKSLQAYKIRDDYNLLDDLYSQTQEY